MRDGIKKSLKKSCLSLAWKIKAIKRRWELKALNKRFEEVVESRAQWKQKANDRHTEIQRLANELTKLKIDYENLKKKV
jgi:predicted  nucleic acid-binding Zn-ribbon protein